MAKAYLAEHRELMVDARATVERWTLEGVFGKRTPSEPKSTTSALQISGAK
jgi:hypothetical protein